MFLTIRDILKPDEKPKELFEIDGIKIGVVVCEDFWNDKTFWKERLYDNDPTEEVNSDKARI